MDYNYWGLMCLWYGVIPYALWTIFKYSVRKLLILHWGQAKVDHVNMRGKVALVTGINIYANKYLKKQNYDILCYITGTTMGGIGFETVVELASRFAIFILYKFLYVFNVKNILKFQRGNNNSHWKNVESCKENHNWNSEQNISWNFGTSSSLFNLH